MPKTVTKSVAKLERLSTALNSYQAAMRAYAKASGWTEHQLVVALCYAESRLTDAAVACGMSVDHPNVEEWAAEAVAGFLCAA